MGSRNIMSIYLTQTITVWLLIPHLIRMMKAKGPTQISFFFYYSVQAQWQSHCTKTQEIKPSEKGSLSLSQALEFEEFEELIRGRHYYYYYYKCFTIRVCVFWLLATHLLHSLVATSFSNQTTAPTLLASFFSKRGGPSVPLRFSLLHHSSPLLRYAFA